MPKAKNVHVVFRQDGWAIRSEGSSSVRSVHETQRAAVEAAREIARSNSGELLIHGRDGRIRARDSYVSDPQPPRGRTVLFPKAASTSKKAIKKAVSAVVRESKNSSKGIRGSSAKY